MKWCEMFKENGIFKALYAIDAQTMNTVLGERTVEDIEVLDGYAEFQTGERTLVKLCDSFNAQSGNEMAVRKLASYALVKFRDWWLGTVELMGVEWDILTPHTLIRETEGETVDDMNDKEQVFAYDSEEGSNSTATARKTENARSEKVIERRSDNGKTVTELQKEQMNFEKQNRIIDIVLNDLQDLLCVDIY